MKRAFVFSVPMAFVTAGVVLIAGYFMESKTALRISQWTQALGTIERVAGSEKGGEVSYRYELGGRQYRSENVPFRERRDPFRVGQTQLVYVNPADPGESVLEPARRASPWRGITGTFAVLLGTILGLFFWRDSVRRSRRRYPRRKSPPMSRLRPPSPIKRA